jgi:REP element-mobilizing transposase RayT
VLKHDLLTFSDSEIAVIGETFGKVIRRRPYTCYAAAIMPDHVHLLVRRHRDTAEEMIAGLQEASREAVLKLGERSATHPVWGGPGWKAYLETVDDFVRVARYIEENPIKARRPRQTWDFVQAYDGWLPGPRFLRPAKPQARRRSH